MEKMALALLLFLSLSAPAWAGGDGGCVTQVSVIDALLSGIYEGNMPAANLKKHGDFGIGTFNNLSGEMAMLDGVIYEIRADGAAHPATGLYTPFAAVTRFVPTAEMKGKGEYNYDALQEFIDARLANKNNFIAVRISGLFTAVMTRAPRAQTKPYPPLAEVMKNQAVFELANVGGTMLGFRLPAYVKGANVPGYHLHFLSDARPRAGGHVLGFTVKDPVIQISAKNCLTILAPEDAAFAAAELGKDRSAELKAVEKGTDEKGK